MFSYTNSYPPNLVLAKHIIINYSHLLAHNVKAGLHLRVGNIESRDSRGLRYRAGARGDLPLDSRCRLRQEETGVYIDKISIHPLQLFSFLNAGECHKHTMELQGKPIWDKVKIKISIKYTCFRSHTPESATNTLGTTTRTHLGHRQLNTRQSFPFGMLASHPRGCLNAFTTGNPLLLQIYLNLE